MYARMSYNHAYTPVQAPDGRRRHAPKYFAMTKHHSVAASAKKEALAKEAQPAIAARACAVFWPVLTRQFSFSMPQPEKNHRGSKQFLYDIFESFGNECSDSTVI